MFATIVCAFGSDYPIFNLVDISGDIKIYNLKVLTPAFWTFLVCHFFPPFLNVQPTHSTRAISATAMAMMMIDSIISQVQIRKQKPTGCRTKLSCQPSS